MLIEDQILEILGKHENLLLLRGVDISDLNFVCDPQLATRKVLNLKTTPNLRIVVFLELHIRGKIESRVYIHIMKPFQLKKSLPKKYKTRYKETDFEEYEFSNLESTRRFLTNFFKNI